MGKKTGAQTRRLVLGLDADRGRTGSQHRALPPVTPRVQLGNSPQPLSVTRTTNPHPCPSPTAQLQHCGEKLDDLSQRVLEALGLGWGGLILGRLHPPGIPLPGLAGGHL